MELVPKVIPLTEEYPIARGSLSGLYTHLELGKRLGYFTRDSLAVLDSEMFQIDKMISGLVQH